jgi:hypothetical protein
MQREAYSRERFARRILLVVLCFFLLLLGILIGYLYKLGSGS